MISRSRLLSEIPTTFDIRVLPAWEHDDLALYCQKHHLTADTPKNELIRRFLLDPPTESIKHLIPSSLAILLGVDRAAVSRQKSLIQTGGGSQTVRRAGKPSLLGQTREKDVSAWLTERVRKGDFPSLREVKERIWIELERSGITGIPSRNYFQAVINRIAGENFVVRTANPLESQRWDVKKEDVEAYYNSLRCANVEDITPSLIINIDEIGFGQSKSGRGKPMKVLCPRDHVGPVSYRAKDDRHYVTAIGAITASGKCLPPGVIIRRQTEHPDMFTMPFSATSRIYSSPKAFISRSIFEDYVINIVARYIDARRTELHDTTRPAMIIMDGHKSHLTDALNAVLASMSITLVALPPHTSHILQPLDQGFFRMVKRYYSQYGSIEGISQISSVLQRVSNAFQAATVDWTIIQSWRHTGLNPEIDGGVAARVVVQLERVLTSDELHTAPVNEHAQGKRIMTGRYGVLNEAEIDLRDSGLCPLCCSPLTEEKQKWMDPDMV